MDFITLADLVEELAQEPLGKVDLAELTEEKSDAVRAGIYSQVAGTLHQALHNERDCCPRWYDTKKTGYPLRSDEAGKEGVAILEHMAGWAGRERREAMNHLNDQISAERADIDPALVLRGYNVASGQYIGANYFKAQAIGFDRNEMANFLGRATKQTEESNGDLQANRQPTREDEEPQTRTHELHELIAETFEELERPKFNRPVWMALKRLAGEEGGIIQEIKGNVIYWLSSWDVEQTMTRKTHDNFLGKLRNNKKHPG